MISELSLAKALRDKLKSLTSLDVVSLDNNYEPNPSVDYVREKVMTGNVNITLTPSDSENANGIYQIDIYTSVSKKNKWYGLQLRDSIKEGFTKGLTANIEDGGQKVIINNVNTPPMRMSDGNMHRIHTLDVNFRVIG